MEMVWVIIGLFPLPEVLIPLFIFIYSSGEFRNLYSILSVTVIGLAIGYIGGFLIAPLLALIYRKKANENILRYHYHSFMEKSEKVYAIGIILRLIFYVCLSYMFLIAILYRT